MRELRHILWENEVYAYTARYAGIVRGTRAAWTIALQLVWYFHVADVLDRRLHQQ